MSESRYRPEIDGLRALAVGSVVLFHAGLGAPGGYVGVDVFFVISGFLITSIILRSIEADTFSLADFWERRVRRIVPALASMVAVVLCTGLYLLMPTDLVSLGKSSISQVLLASNFYFWRDTGYFATSADLKPLLHTWSLAVEEQFYLIFPLFLVTLKGQTRRSIFLIVACISLVSFMAGLYGTRFHPGAAFFLLPTRAWELFAGCLLAVAPGKPISHKLRDELLGLLGLGAILGAVFCYDSRTPFPGLAAVLPVAGTVAVIFATSATTGTIVGRALSARPLVFVGLISYSMYLWHWPILAYGRYVSPSMGHIQIAASLALTFALSVLSWRFIETPFRRGRIRSRRPVVFGSAAAATAVLLCGSIIFVGGDGLPGRFDGKISMLVDDISWTGSEFETPDTETIVSRELPQLGIPRSPNSPLDFVLWGDSHGMALSPLIDQVAKESKVAGTAILVRGIPPVPNLWKPARDPGGERTRRRNQAVMEYLAATRPRNLLLVARWSSYCCGSSQVELRADPKSKVTTNMVTDKAGASLSAPNSAMALSRQLENLVASCERFGTRVWIFQQVPETGELETAGQFVKWSARPEWFRRPGRTRSIADHLERQQFPQQVFAQLSAKQVQLVDPAPYCFDERGMTINFQDGRACYRDEDHLSRWGARRLEGLVTQMMVEMKASPRRLAAEPGGATEREAIRR